MVEENKKYIKELNKISEERNTIKNYKKLVKWFEEIPIEKISEIEPELKSFEEKINKEYETDPEAEMIERESGLNGFEINYQIKGREGLNPNQFFDRVENVLIDFLKKINEK